MSTWTPRRPWRPWSLMPSYNLDLEDVGQCNSEPLKQSKSSRWQMFFEIGSLKNFAIFTGKNSNTGASCGHYRIFLRTAFFIEHLRWLLLTVLLQHSNVSWSVCSLISHLYVLSILNNNLHKTLRKQIFTITWQSNFFLAWIDWSRGFNFRIWFWNTVEV